MTIELTMPMSTRVQKSDGDTVHLTRAAKDVFVTIGKFLPVSISDSVRFHWKSFVDSTTIDFAFRNHLTLDRVSGWVKLSKETKSGGQWRHDTITVRVEDAPWREEEKENVIEIKGSSIANGLKELAWSSAYPDTGDGPWTERLQAVGPLGSTSAMKIRFKHRR